MSTQIELFRKPGLSIQPSNPEPRLWVQRLVIWSEPHTVLRDIPLRRGLNILWSPDRVGAGFELGHGAGKSMLCRLLRYCLGEDSFGPDEVQGRVGAAFKDGRVGIEARLGGRLWSVTRSLGPVPMDRAAPNVCLELLLHDGAPPGSFTQWMDTLQSTLVPKDALPLMPEPQGHFPWLYCLAWLSRDQECRFAGLLDWRSAASGSHSPVRHSSAAMRLAALRVMAGLLGPEEHRLERAMSERRDELERANREVQQLERDRSRLRRRIAGGLGMEVGEMIDGPLAVEHLRQQAVDLLEQSELPEEEPSESPVSSQLSELRQRQQRLLSRGMEARAEVQRLKLLVGEQGRALRQAQSPVCPIDGAPLDVVKLKGCGFASRLPDPEAAQASLDESREELRTAEAESRRVEQQVEALTGQIEALEAEEAQARKGREALLRNLAEMRERWFRARKLNEDVEEFAGQQEELDRARSTVAYLETGIGELKEDQEKCRLEQEEALGRLARRFDQLVRHVAGHGASGDLKLDGRGLSAIIRAGGERSSVAMESLKVIAFDISLLIAAAEGEGNMPALLIHDSPREADLSIQVYHRLFEAIRLLEGDEPAFQYLLTTTTEPPESLQKAPWLVLQLSGSDTEGRLFGRDL